ncbi:hypothetical protein ACFYWX_28835 [Streptomyces sp. NPDC002888]|uniref:hypothetical protein n=1 Tax=Streptomyces sp. NPDC002888 TaxID=3364668 RepID=UPI0036A0AE66
MNLDPALIGHWSSTPFDIGVMETSGIELRADGSGSGTVANAAGDDTGEFHWGCPEAGVLELRDGGDVTRHRYSVGPVVPPYATEVVTTVTFEEVVLYAHQFVKWG